MKQLFENVDLPKTSKAHTRVFFPASLIQEYVSFIKCGVLVYRLLLSKVETMLEKPFESRFLKFDT